LLDLVSSSAELLSSYQFPGDKTPVIRGSRQGAQLREGETATRRSYKLYEALDTFVPLPERRSTSRS